MTTNYNNIIEQLAVKYCPIIYFNKDEPYMPSNFADMISISDLYEVEPVFDMKKRPKIKNLIKTNPTIQDLTPTSLISINKNKIHNIPVGHEIICRTKGIYKLINDSDKFIDLLYIVYFAFNGTIKSHLYDQEFIIVRLYTQYDINDLKKWTMLKCFGSIHGGGLWYDAVNIDMEVVDGVKRPVFYSANESHAMYHKPGIYKRIFRFGDDKTRKDKRWSPTKLICMIDSRASPYTNIYNYSTKQFEYNKKTDNYYRFSGLIGYANENKTQAWAGSNVYIYLQYYYDTINTLPFPKYEGGISNLFVGSNKKIDYIIRYAVYWTCIFIWILITLLGLFLLYKLYKPTLKSKKSILIFSILSVLTIIGFILYLIICFYICLNFFIINDSLYADKKVPHLIMLDDENLNDENLNN